MVDKKDSLGRRIPQFDRSAAGKKSAKTLKEKYGKDYLADIGSRGGRNHTRGYFGKLKDEGRTAEINDISTQGIKAREAKKDE